MVIGLGPTQQAGRDARRISDLHEIQTGLQLYYNANSHFPDTNWAGLAGMLVSVGVSSVPNDPVNNGNYIYKYAATADGNDYVVGAQFENAGNSVFSGYTSPSDLGSLSGNGDKMYDCLGPKDASGTPQSYCLSL